MKESERIDAELTRVEARLGFVADEVYKLKRRAAKIEDDMAREADPRLKTELQRQLGRTIEARDEKEKEEFDLKEQADELGRAFRAEMAFQEERQNKPKPDHQDEGFNEEEWLRKRELKRKIKL